MWFIKFLILNTITKLYPSRGITTFCTEKPLYTILLGQGRFSSTQFALRVRVKVTKYDVATDNTGGNIREI